MNFKKHILLSILVIFNSAFAFSQNNSSEHKVNIKIPEVALLRLVSNNSTTIALQSTSPVEAGNSIDFSNKSQNKNLWINYSSIIRNSSHRRKIVAVIQGELPKGVQIRVEASDATGIGKGQRGSSVGSVKLSKQPKEIITNIASCYTGKGPSNGHFLTYQLEFDESEDNYSQLAQAKTSCNIVYTLTDLN